MKHWMIRSRLLAIAIAVPLLASSAIIMSLLLSGNRTDYSAFSKEQLAGEIDHVLFCPHYGWPYVMSHDAEFVGAVKDWLLQASVPEPSIIPISLPAAGHPLIISMKNNTRVVMLIGSTTGRFQDFLDGHEYCVSSYVRSDIPVEWGCYRVVNTDNPFTKYLEQMRARPSSPEKAFLVHASLEEFVTNRNTP